MTHGTILTLTNTVQGLLNARAAGIGIAGQCKALEAANIQVLLALSAKLQEEDRAREAAKNRTQLVRMDEVDLEIFGGAGKLPSGEPFISSSTVELPGGKPAYLIVDCTSDASGEFRVGLIWENDRGEAMDMRVGFDRESDAVDFANLYLEGRISLSAFGSLSDHARSF